MALDKSLHMCDYSSEEFLPYGRDKERKAQIHNRSISFEMNTIFVALEVRI